MVKATTRQRPKRRNNWPLRTTALFGSIGALVGFWQLAVHNPHPNIGVESTPISGDNYTVPTGHGANPLPLPTVHTSTSASK